MARRTVGPRRSDSPRTYLRPTRIIGGLSVLALAGAVVWDLNNDEFWFRHTLFTALVASLIVVAVSAGPAEQVAHRLPVSLGRGEDRHMAVGARVGVVRRHG